MNKKCYTALALLLLAGKAATAQTTTAAPYCTPVFGTVTSSNPGGISSVGYGSTTNPTNIQENHYTFYSNLPALSITAGSSFLFNVVAGGGASGKILTLYVDWNQDHVFSTQSAGIYSEAVQSQSIGTGGSVSLGGLIGDTVVAGTTRARIMWVSGVDPCQSTGTPYDGEIEDYQVTISGTKPIPRVSAATNLTGMNATLNGTVHANGPGAATVDFEYGATATYTNSISGGTVTASAHTPVTAGITGLTRNTIYHYRVKSTNSFGTSYSPDQTFVTTSGVGIEQATATAYTISPNPGNGLIRISGLLPAHSYRSEVYDLAGRKVAESALSPEGTLDIRNLTKGIYMLKIADLRDPSGLLPVSRVVIQ